MLGAYPIGSIYLSVNNTSPASLFGGTWEKIQDRFLLASGSSYSLGATGGEVNHKLTESEIPAHAHDLANGSGGSNYVRSWCAGSYWDSANQTSNARNDFYTLGTNNTGGSQPHNNMPPYLVVNVWKRIS